MESLALLLENAGLEQKPYQVEGVRWCLERELVRRGGEGEGVRGGILADEMGLGKTITLLGLMAVNPVERTLIVLPVALIDQWIAQIRRILGFPGLVVYHGASKKTVGLTELKAASIVVTSYSHISMQVSHVKMGGVDVEVEEGGLLHRVVWDRIVYDEAHHLRNRQTRCFAGANTLTKSASCAQWFITGTPVQNSMKDFHALCSLLGVPASLLKDIDEVLRLYVLRRTKKDVGLGLPDVVTSYRPVPWAHDCEKALALEVHSWIPFSGLEKEKEKETEKETEKEKQIEKTLPPPPIVGGGGGGGGGDLEFMLVRYMRAKQVCVLPRLLSKHIHKKKKDPLFYEAMDCSSKIDAVLEVIGERAGNGNGKLVFCHFKEEIDTLEQRIAALGLNVAKIDGRSTRSQKKTILGLEGGYDVLLLQIQTCCEGLNLQEFYSEIYFVTPHWNPSVEDQAIARCHRIGQQKQVYVFRFLMDGCHMQADTGEESLVDKDKDYITLDHYVYCVQERKRLLAF